MTVLDAAFSVLQSVDAPLHYDEITRRALEAGLWATTGKTPSATMVARLSTDIKKRGAGSQFVRTAPGVFGLRAAGDAPATSASVAAPPDVPAPATPTMSFTDAAEHVLRHHAGRRPMHYRAIAERALADDLVTTQGKTPEATLYAQVLTEIKRRTRRGEASRFVRHGKGYVGLRAWAGRGLAFEIERHNAEVRAKLLARLQTVTPAEFEALVGRLLVALGFEDVTITPLSADGGIDVRGTLVVGDAVRTRMAVQAKRWKANVQSPTVQQVRGSLGAHEQGLIITTGGFSAGARKEAERPDATPVGLMDGEGLVKLLVENDIGVTRTPAELLDLAALDGSDTDDEA